MTQVVVKEASKATASLNFVGSVMEEFYGIILTHYFPFVFQLLSNKLSTVQQILCDISNILA